MNKTSVDSVTLSVIWNSLLSIADEMASALARTAFSEAVREGQDFSTGIFDRDGRLIAQGNCSPGHLGAMPFVVKAVMEYFPRETLKQGDGILLNDPEIGTGHYPDFLLINPVFMDNELIAYVVNTAHHVDVGGASPGSQKVHGVTEAYQEGLRLPPVMILKEEQFDENILSIIMANVRLPDKVKGDLRAQVNANYVGSKRLLSLFEKYGFETLYQSIESILARTETRMRDFIRELPNGLYSFEDYLDDCGPDHGSVLVAVDITVDNDEITVDFSRSSDQVSMAINSYINYTRAYTIFAVKVFADALLPQNEGVVNPIHVTARKGSFFNPEFPAPCGGRAAVQIRIFEVINGAFAKVLPTRVMGAFSHWNNPNISGIDESTGERFIMYDLIFGGYGGLSFKDGTEALVPVLNCANIPIEVHEANNPIMIKCLELIPDSGGAGRYRGGCGIRKDVELLTESAVITLLGDRHVHEPFGLLDGHPGKLAETVLLRGGEEIQMSSKEVCVLCRGDVVSFRLNGGGGYGDPSERAIEAIRRDIEEGYISEAFARDVYGIEDFALNTQVTR